MSYLALIASALADLQERSLRRTLRAALPAGALDFTSNDYLGLAHDFSIVGALRGAAQFGSGGSRLLAGAHPEHMALERDLAEWTGRERALLFSSGYLAALGAIVTLAPFVKRIRSDVRLHACGIDAIRLTNLPRATYPHDTYGLTNAAREGEPTMVVTESLFGVSGTRVDIRALLARLGRHDVLLVDEAHALGVAGASGAGLCAGIDDPRIVVIGTLSKALGGLGGFVAGPTAVIDYLVTAARTFIFDTALPPALAGALRTALEHARGDFGDRARARLAENVSALVAGLRSHDSSVPHALGPIVPIIIGDAAQAVAIGVALEARGIFAPALRPPTVADGASQLRATVRANHSQADIDAFIRAYAGVRTPHRTRP